MRGESLTNAHPAIRLFSLCEGFKWTLPVPGGIYAQDPVLMDKFAYMFSRRAVIQEEEAKKREREAKRGKSPAARNAARPAGGRKRRK